MTILPIFLAVVFAVSDTTGYTVLNHGRPAGEMLVVRDGESVTVRYHHIDRNRGQRFETRYRVDTSGAPVSGEFRALTLDGQPNGPVERFEVIGNSVQFTGSQSTTVPRTDGSFVRLRGSGFEEAWLVRYLLTRSNRSATLLPTGNARLEIVADTAVSTSQGRERVRLAAVFRAGSSVPTLVWIDDRGELVTTSVGWFMTVRNGAERALPLLRGIEIAYRNREAEALARKLDQVRTRTVLIKNGNVFDSERGVMRSGMSVLIDGDRITAVGPASDVKTPAGALIIDAGGKSIVPGLYDMHTHFQLTSQNAGAAMQLAAGITTIRDLAADIDVATAHRDRAERGDIISPRAILGGFIEGPGRWAGPSEVIVRTEDEARAWVARYDSLGYRQIKLYNLVHPDLVPTIAEEAHRRGMRLSGHIPRGLSVPAAIRLGFDEINHAAFLFSTFFQDSLYLPMRAYSAVAAAVAPHVDVDGAQMTALIDVLKHHGTVIDGTFNLWMRGSTAPRSNATGQHPAIGDTLAEKSNANYLRLIKRLYDTGVTLVAGTDGSSYNEELENYERAGIPAANVLQIATIVPARVMKEERDYGSITAGKIADIVIVEGNPAQRIADLRNVYRVIRAGRVYDPDEINAALGRRMARTRTTS